MRGKNCERRAKFIAQPCERQAGALGDFGKADLLEPLVGEKAKEGSDDLFTIAGVWRRRGMGRAGGAVGSRRRSTGRSVGHETPPCNAFRCLQPHFWRPIPAAAVFP